MNFFLNKIRPAWCCLIALLAPCLGGSTERWAQGAVMLLVCGLVVFFPPRSFGPRGFFFAAVALVCLAALSFFPAAWFGTPGWRSELTGAGGIALPPVLSPQPWISAECLALLATGILWVRWLSLQTWEAAERRWMAEVFVFGAALLAAVALTAFYCKTPVAIWHSERGFGPFPNRNQTGNFFAVSGILALGCAYENFRRKKFRAVFFSIATLLTVAALITSYSRAAVLLFFAGACVWTASLAAVSRSAKPAALCASVVILIAAVFLIFGGDTLQRFRGGDGVSFGFRLLIYKDALALVRASPWCGIGLGNFEGVFALFRNASAMPSRILHPESDWLWLAAEGGWIAVALVVFAVAVLAKRIFPLDHGTQRRLRLSAAAAALVFAAHGLVDVPGHRLGSALPGLFALGLALNNPADPRGSRFAPPAFRLAAVAIGAVGAAWICAPLQNKILPGATGVSALKQRAKTFLAEKDFPDATTEAACAIAWAPLDWELYFLRAFAEVRDGNWPRALDDFRRANMLEPTSPAVTCEEGKIWLGSQPALALIPWRDTLRRCPPEEAAQYYSQMLGCVNGTPELRRLLHPLARGNFDLELVYLRDSTAEEFRGFSAAVLQRDPGLHSLSDIRKTAFFHIWAERGDAEKLMQLLSANAQWQQLAWRQVADYKAANNDAKGACETAFKFLAAPVLPKLSETADIAGLKRRLLLNPGDYRAGCSLYEAFVAQKNTDAALGILRTLTSRTDCPRYFHYLEARMAFQAENFAAAWDALKKYNAPGD